VWQQLGHNCQDVDTGISRSSLDCCIVGQYTDGGHCKPCAGGFTCNALGTDSTSLSVSSGMWRADLVSVKLHDCFNADACTGGVATTSVDQYCVPGYIGPCKCFLLNLLLTSSTAAYACNAAVVIIH
jgi:hypothetical protein